MTKPGQLLDANQVFLINRHLWRRRDFNELPVVIFVLSNLGAFRRHLVDVDLRLDFLAVLHLYISVFHVLGMLHNIAIQVLHVALFQAEAFVLRDQRFIEAKCYEQIVVRAL